MLFDLSFFSSLDKLLFADRVFDLIADLRGELVAEFLDLLFFLTSSFGPIDQETSFWDC